MFLAIMEYMKDYLLDWKLLITIPVAALYLYLTWHFDYFKNKNIPYVKPYPLFGTAHTVIFQKLKFIDFYKKYGKVFGMFQGRYPVLVVGKEEMLREIFVKQFASFTDHAFNKFGDQYVDRILSLLHGEDWRNIRRKLTPTFTTGRLRGMASDMNACCREMVICLNKKITERSTTEMDTKPFLGNLSLDVIGRTTFGLDLNSQKDDKNDFVRHAKSFVLGTTWRSILLSPFMFIYPPLLNFLGKLGLGLFSPTAIKFFTDIVEHVLKARGTEIEQRNDFMAIMAKQNREMELEEKDEKTGVSKGLEKIDILASGFVFFLAGYDSVSSGMSIVLYHLATNPDWQEKIYEEAETLLKQHDGEGDDISYNTLSEMHQLEMFIDESFRFTSPAAFNDRYCTESATVDEIFIEKGTNLWIPINAIHHDPEYYPDPEKFDPLRFTPEKKAARSKFIYLPFGVGPRECIAKRLALMEIKMAVVYILRNFVLGIGPENKGLIKNVFQQVAEVYLTIESRKKTN